MHFFYICRMKTPLEFYNKYPLRSILLIGLIVRLISVFFSSGYGMHDDHYLVIEAAQSWVDGFDYNNWLPENSVSGDPTGHSFFYVGLHYIFFLICDIVGLNDPHIKMLIIRLFHGLFSLLTVYFGYRITGKLSNAENARTVGLLLALYWFMPILSVRNLVEMVCIPFVLAIFWTLIKKEPKYKDFALAGILMGLAIGIRIQTYLILGGIGLVLLFERRIVGAVIFGLFSMAALFVTQITDLFLWGRPFAEISQYVFYNSTAYNDYMTQSWYQYLLVILGILIPPFSIYFLFGMFRSWKKYALLFVPIMLFIAFHSIYPNKQERFILPVIPLIVIMGLIGWREFIEKSRFWQERPGLYKGSVRFFWTINLLALLIVSPASTKKSIADSMYYLFDKGDVNGIFYERSFNNNCYLFPRFYSGKWDILQFCYTEDQKETYKEVGIKALVESLGTNYVFFLEDHNLEKRVGAMKKAFPEMEFLKKIEPSYLDKWLHYLNPVNRNEVIYIYKISSFTR